MIQPSDPADADAVCLVCGGRYMCRVDCPRAARVAADFSHVKQSPLLDIVEDLAVAVLSVAFMPVIIVATALAILRGSKPKR